MESGNTRLYITKDVNNWQDKVSRNYENISTCNFVEVKNGYILPLKRLPSEPNVPTNGVYVGGVQSENGKFVAGHRRHYDDNFNLSCSSTYMIDEQLCKEIIVSDETVIYGGVVIDIFGHVLSEAFSRLWYILEHNYGYRIAFCHRGSEIPNYFYEFMKLLGISSEQILIIDKPMRFKNIIVPDQACANCIGYHSKVSDIYITMMATAQKNIVYN